jgi:uracil-DNA glycosylase family 4
VAHTKRRAFQDCEYWGRPVPGFGDPRAGHLIVGLAPAAHGANRTGRMFTGDASGDWLYEALHRFGFASQPNATTRHDGLVLHDCYITAAGRCAPPNNRPTQAELDSCEPFLRSEIRLLHRVRVTLALGHVAFQQWLRASRWNDWLDAAHRPRFAHGAVTTLPDGMALVTSYHPSRQNTQTGRLTRSMWYGVFETVRSLTAA